MNSRVSLAAAKRGQERSDPCRLSQASRRAWNTRSHASSTPAGPAGPASQALPKLRVAGSNPVVRFYASHLAPLNKFGKQRRLSAVGEVL
jgi:hypothetical protein